MTYYSEPDIRIPEKRIAQRERAKRPKKKRIGRRAYMQLHRIRVGCLVEHKDTGKQGEVLGISRRFQIEVGGIGIKLEPQEFVRVTT